VYDNLNFDFIRDVAPVASVGVVPFFMVVNPSFPAQTISEFIAWSSGRSRPLPCKDQDVRRSGTNGTLIGFACA